MANTFEIRININSSGTITASNNINKLNSSLKDTETVVDKLKNGFAKLAAAVAGIHMAANVFDSFFHVNIAYEKAIKGFTAVTGSIEGANREMSFLANMAHQYGLRLTNISREYLSFVATANSTVAAGQPAQYIFEGLSNAMVKLGRTSEETKGALKAMGQMLSKGTVYAEELKGQLAEWLPGAVPLAAEAMDMKIKQLFKAMENGAINSAEMLIKMTKVMNDKYFTGELIKTLPGEWARLQNEIDKTFITVNSHFGVFDYLIKKIHGAAEAFEGFAQQIAEGKYDKIANALSKIITVVALLSSYFLALKIFGGVFKSIANWVSLITKPTQLATAAVLLLIAAFRVLAANPIVALVGLASYLYSIKDETIKVGDTTATQADRMKAVWQVAVSNIKETFTMLFNFLDEKFTAWSEKTLTWLRESGMLNKINEYLNKEDRYFFADVTHRSGNTQPTSDDVVTGTEMFVDPVTSAKDSILDSLRDQINAQTILNAKEQQQVDLAKQKTEQMKIAQKRLQIEQDANAALAQLKQQTAEEVASDTAAWVESMAKALNFTKEQTAEFKKIAPYIRYWSEKMKVPPEVTAVIAYLETGRGHGFSMNAVSPAGARGTMQIMPNTAMSVSNKFLGEELDPAWKTDVSANIRLGVAFLKDLVNKYDYSKAAVAYNMGETRKGFRTGNYPTETRNYLNEFNRLMNKVTLAGLTTESQDNVLKKISRNHLEQLNAEAEEAEANEKKIAEQSKSIKELTDNTVLNKGAVTALTEANELYRLGLERQETTQEIVDKSRMRLIEKEFKLTDQQEKTLAIVKANIDVYDPLAEIQLKQLEYYYKLEAAREAGGITLQQESDYLKQNQIDLLNSSASVEEYYKTLNDLKSKYYKEPFNESTTSLEENRKQIEFIQNAYKKGNLTPDIYNNMMSNVLLEQEKITKQIEDNILKSKGKIGEYLIDLRDEVKDTSAIFVEAISQIPDLLTDALIEGEADIKGFFKNIAKIITQNNFKQIQFDILASFYLDENGKHTSNGTTSQTNNTANGQLAFNGVDYGQMTGAVSEGLMRFYTSSAGSNSVAATFGNAISNPGFSSYFTDQTTASTVSASAGSSVAGSTAGYLQSARTTQVMGLSGSSWGSIAGVAGSYISSQAFDGEYVGTGSAVGSTIGGVIGATVTGGNPIGYAVGSVIGSMIGGWVGSAVSDKTAPRAQYIATTKPSGTPDWFEDDVYSTSESFGLQFGLGDKSHKIEASEYAEVFAGFAKTADILAEFFGEDVTQFITNMINNTTDEMKGLGLAIDTYSSDEAFQHIFGSIIDFGAQSGDLIAVEFDRLVGQLGGTVQEMADRLDAAILAVLNMSNAARTLSGNDLGNLLEIKPYDAQMATWQTVVNEYNAVMALSSNSLLSTLDEASRNVATFLINDLKNVDAQIAEALSVGNDTQTLEAFRTNITNKLDEFFDFSQLELDARFSQTGIDEDSEAVLTSAFNTFHELSAIFADDLVEADAINVMMTSLDLFNQSLYDSATVIDDFISKEQFALAAKAMLDVFGDTQVWSDRMTYYYDEFYTDSARSAMLLKFANEDLDAASQRLGVTVPRTHEEFVNLIDSIDITTASGATLKAELLNLVETIDLVADYSSSSATILGNTIASINETSGLSDTIRGIFDTVFSEAESASDVRQKAEEQFTRMIWEHLTNNLLTSISQSIVDSVITPWLSSVGIASTNLVTGSVVAENNIATGSIIAGNNLTTGSIVAGTNLQTGGALAEQSLATGGAIASAELTAIVDNAIATVNMVAALYESPEFQAAMSELGIAIGTIAESVYSASTSVGYQYTQLESDSAGDNATDTANDVADIAKEKLSLEIELLQLQGKATEALNKQRDSELSELDASLHALKNEIWALEDAAKLRALNVTILGLEGKTTEALAISRQIELDALTDAEKPLQQRIWQLQDEAKLTSLTINILELEGRASEALALTRQQELNTLTDGEQVLQQRIWLLEDEQAQLEKFNELLHVFDSENASVAWRQTQALLNDIGVNTIPRTTAALYDLMYSYALSDSQIATLTVGYNALVTAQSNLASAFPVTVDALTYVPVLFNDLGIAAYETAEAFSEFLATTELLPSVVVALGQNQDIITEYFSLIEQSQQDSLENIRQLAIDGFNEQLDIANDYLNTIEESINAIKSLQDQVDDLLGRNDRQSILERGQQSASQLGVEFSIASFDTYLADQAHYYDEQKTLTESSIKTLTDAMDVWQDAELDKLGDLINTLEDGTVAQQFLLAFKPLMDAVLGTQTQNTATVNPTVQETSPSILTNPVFGGSRENPYFGTSFVIPVANERSAVSQPRAAIEPVFYGIDATQATNTAVVNNPPVNITIDTSADITTNGGFDDDSANDLLAALQLIQPLFDSFANPDYNALENITALFDELGYALPSTSEAFADFIYTAELSDLTLATLGASVDDLTTGYKQVSDLFNNFTIDATLTTNLQEATALLRELGFSMPNTSQGFADLLHSGKLTADQLFTLADHSDLLTQTFSQLDDVNEQKADKEIEKLKLLGFASHALTREREIELDSMDESLRAIQSEIWALEDAATLRTLNASILELEGRVTEALAISRQTELDALTDAEKPLQQRIWQLEDEAKLIDWTAKLLKSEGQATTALLLTRQEELKALTDAEKTYQLRIWQLQDEAEILDLNTQIMELQGQAAEAVVLSRQEELKTLVNAQRLLQLRIWQLEDENAIVDEQTSLLSSLHDTTQSLQLSRQLELEALNESNRALQQHIWLIEEQTEQFNTNRSFIAELKTYSDDDSLALLTNTFAEWGITLPTTSNALYDLIVSGGLTTEQLTLLANHSDIVSAALNDQSTELDNLVSKLDALGDSIKFLMESIVTTKNELSDMEVPLSDLRRNAMTELVFTSVSDMDETLPRANEYYTALSDLGNELKTLAEQSVDLSESIQLTQDSLLNVQPDFDAMRASIARLGTATDADVITDLLENAEEYRAALEQLGSTMLQLKDNSKAFSELLQNDIDSLLEITPDLEVLRTNALGALAIADTDKTITEALDLADEYRAALLENHQTELDALTARNDAAQQLLDWVLEMERATDDAISATQRRLVALNQFEATLVQAQGGDTEAMGTLSTNATDYLDAYKYLATDKVSYEREYARVINAVRDVANANTVDVESETEALKIATTGKLQELKDATDGQTTRIETIITDVVANLANLQASVDLQTTRTEIAINGVVFGLTELRTWLSSLEITAQTRHDAIVESLNTINGSLITIAAQTAEDDRAIESNYGLYGAMPVIDTVTEELINGLYRTLFNRNADQEGLEYWSNEWDAGLYDSIEELTYAMATAANQNPQGGDEYAHYVALFGTPMTDTQRMVNDLYKLLFNREADTGGLNYWSNEWDAGLYANTSELINSMAFAASQHPQGAADYAYYTQNFGQLETAETITAETLAIQTADITSALSTQTTGLTLSINTQTNSLNDTVTLKANEVIASINTQTNVLTDATIAQTIAMTDAIIAQTIAMTDAISAQTLILHDAIKVQTVVLSDTMIIKSNEIINQMTTMKAANSAFYSSNISALNNYGNAIIAAINALNINIHVAVTNVSNSYSTGGSVGGFATGGIVDGPTTGFSATLHGREAIIPLGDGNVLRMDTSGLEEELAAMREELRALREEQQRQHHASLREQRDTAEVLKKWETIGQPTERAAA